MPYGQNGVLPQSYYQQNNPYLSSQQYPRYEIIRVNGENGANALQMGPNSSLFVADETKPDRIWLLMTDGAGYKTKRAIKAVFEDVAEKANVEALMASFEARLKALEEAQNEQLNSRSSKQRSARASGNDGAES